MKQFNQDGFKQSRQVTIVMKLVDILNSPDFNLLDMKMLSTILQEQENTDTLQERCETLSEGLQDIANELL